MGQPIDRDRELLPCYDPSRINPRCDDCGGALVWQALECDPEDFFWDCPECIRALARHYGCTEPYFEGE